MTYQPHSSDDAHADTETHKPSFILEHWLLLLVGAATSYGIMSLSADSFSVTLAWVPSALLAFWAVGDWIAHTPPKPKKEEVYDEPKAASLTPAKPAEAPAKAEAVASAPVEAEKPAAPAKKKAAVAIDASTVAILWGSETGTAQGLAEMLETKLNETGLSARAVDMEEVTLEKLQGFSKVLVITSTWGDGEPPSNAISLWEALEKEKVDLAHMRFSVLSLGDTAYPQFCKCGKDFDEFLSGNGAKRIHPRVDCDLDYEGPYAQWAAGVSKALQAEPVAV